MRFFLANEFHVQFIGYWWVVLVLVLEQDIYLQWLCVNCFYAQHSKHPHKTSSLMMFPMNTENFT